MQTFLPFADFAASSAVLDDRRLGKQRVETYQILRALTWPTYAWKNHPAVRMWRGFVPALVAYGLTNCAEWVRRGYADSVADSLLTFTDGRRPDPEALRIRGQLPPWLGLPALHLSHRSALVRKEPQHYRPFFPDVPDDLPYLWPGDTFPQWPVRARDGGEHAALEALGYSDFRPGQREAVSAALDGKDVLALFAPGAGATSTGLLAGLASAPPVLWISTHVGGGGQPPAEGIEVSSAGPRSANRTPAPLTARPPTDVEQLAMAEEAATPPHFLFHRPPDLWAAEVNASLQEAKPSLIVVDLGGATDLSPTDGAAVAQARRQLGEPPLLVVGPGLPPGSRTEAISRLGLHAPVLTGGGYDPERVELSVHVVLSEAGRRRVLGDLATHATGPGLIVAASRESARRLASALRGRGVPVAAAVSGARRQLVEAAAGDWRRGRLRALVVAEPDPPPTALLGRAEVSFVHMAAVPPSPSRYLEWLTLAGRRGGAATSAIVILPAEAAAARESPDPGVAAMGRMVGDVPCRRAALLDEFGEPVQIPCGRCDVCLDRAGG